MKKLFFIICLTQILFANVLIQGALTEETDVLINSLENKKEERIGSYIFYTGKIHGKDIVISRTLVGITNAAAATSIGILKYKPKIIINQGTAGAHDLDLKVGDIVLASKIYNAGSYYTEYSNKEINPYKRIPMKSPLTLLAPKTMQNSINYDKEPWQENSAKEVKVSYFTSDENLLEKAYNFAKTTNFKAIKGVIATADAYNKETKMIELLRKTYNSSAEEMESVAVAQVAKAFDIPFIGIRIISNVEPRQESFDEKTATKCQEFVIDFLKELE